MVDEGSLPSATNLFPSLPSVSESLRIASCIYVCVCVCVCVLGVVPWSSQILSLGHMGSSPSGWLVGSVLATVDRKTLSRCRGHDD